MNRTWALGAAILAAASLGACSQRTQEHAKAAADQAGAATVSAANDIEANTRTAGAKAAAASHKATRKADAAADAAARTD